MSLDGKTILITRAATQSADFRALLEQSGATVIECPAIQIVDPEDWTPVDRAIRRLSEYQWLLLTSANAVDQFMKRAEAADASVAIPIAVVGPATAQRLEKWGLSPSLVAKDFRAEGLLAELPENLSNVAILFPRAETARELLPDELRKRGAAVDVVPVYRTIKADRASQSLPEILASNKVDCVVFTSPSTVRFFAESFDEPLSKVLAGAAIAAIGPVTREAAEAAGLRVSIMPPQSTIPDLAAAICRFLSA